MQQIKKILQEKSDDIVRESIKELKIIFPEYCDIETTERIKNLLQNIYRLILQCITDKRITGIQDFIEKSTAIQSSYDLDFLKKQTALNIFEEKIWEYIIHDFRITQYADSLGIDSTVFQNIEVSKYIQLLELTGQVISNIKIGLAYCFVNSKGDFKSDFNFCHNNAQLLEMMTPLV
jgi:hypothetical protein